MSEPLGLSKAYCADCAYAERSAKAVTDLYVSCAHPKARFRHVVWERDKGLCGRAAINFRRVSAPTPTVATGENGEKE